MNLVDNEDSGKLWIEEVIFAIFFWDGSVKGVVEGEKWGRELEWCSNDRGNGEKGGIRGIGVCEKKGMGSLNLVKFTVMMMMMMMMMCLLSHKNVNTSK